MVFCNSTSCGWACMSKRRVVSNSCPSSRAMETSRALLPKIGSPIGAHRLREGLDGMLRRHEGEFVMQLRHLAVIALQETGQSSGHEPAHARIQPPHDAEIHRRQPPLRIDEQVAGMHVGMKETVAQRLGQEAAHHQHRDLLGIGPAAAIAAVSRSGMPSIHSLVSTPAEVRLQSICGTRNSASPRVRS